MPSVLWAVLFAAVLPSNGTFTVDPAASTLRFTVVHKLHRVEGNAGSMEGKAIVKADGTVLAMVRVPVTSLRTGDGNRDEHMLEALEAGKFPFVVLKGIARLGAERQVPAVPVTLDGEVELHGVKTTSAIPISVLLQPDGSVRARGSFDVSLDAHGVQRPSLLFVKIDDACHIDFDLVLRGGR
jgi:polyisoprenoid-binding protein YceI